MPINIHGKSYNTVAERILSAGTHLKGVITEVLSHDPVVVKATITVSMDEPVAIGSTPPVYTFTGISAANPSKQLEKESPYEVAETSAVGRALAFAGYETTNGIASAEEMRKVTTSGDVRQTIESKPTNLTTEDKCPKCGATMKLSLRNTKYCSKLCWKNPVPDKVVEEEVDSLTKAISEMPS